MFRKEVAESKQQLYGEVILLQPISVYVITMVVCFFILFVSVYLCNLEYSRREVVKGYLIPDKGLIQVLSNRDGVVGELYIKDGDTVVDGESLVRIENSQSLSNGADLPSLLLANLETRISTLENEYTALKIVSRKKTNSLKEKINNYHLNKRALESIIEANLKTLNVKNNQLEVNRELFSKGYISSTHFDSLQEGYFKVLEEHERLNYEVTNLNSDISSLESEINLYPDELAVDKVRIDREISELELEIAEVDNRSGLTLKAPKAGTVTSIQIPIGSRITTEDRILSIIPSNSTLVLDLLLPTRSAGFVELGDRINARFDAFPYQKFGFITGTIVLVDKTLISPSNKSIPFSLTEAVYRVRAHLDKQSIEVYGDSFPLKSGLQAEVDIVLDKRSLLSWLLDPVYSIKGKFE
ncbi:HlyD family efflux transporter periplasmic adaptor subunit [Vibrio splendidus]